MRKQVDRAKIVQLIIRGGGTTARVPLPPDLAARASKDPPVAECIPRVDYSSPYALVHMPVFKAMNPKL
jgi:hypothetical protein